MAEGHAGRSETLPWTIRIFERSALPSACLGALIAAAVFLTSATLATLEGSPIWASQQLWIELLFALLIGYLPTATDYALRGAERDLRDLLPVLDASQQDFRALRARMTRFDRRALIGADLLGIGLGLGVASYRSGWIHDPEAFGPLLFVWVGLRSILLCWLAVRTVYIDVANARRFSELGAQHTRVDLLDLAPLGPYGRRGVRSVGVLVIFVILFSFFALAPWGPGETVAVSLALLLLSSAALLLPVRGVHGRILTVKRDELRVLRATLRSEREAMLELRTRGGVADPHLANLLAYEARIAEVNTWPFDFSTLLRFGLYLVVGIGSWLGAALVERMLGQALD